MTWIKFSFFALVTVLTSIITSYQRPWNTWGFHSCGCEECYLLWYNAVQSWKSTDVNMKQVTIAWYLFHSGFLFGFYTVPKEQMTCSSESSLEFQQTTGRCRRDDRIFNMIWDFRSSKDSYFWRLSCDIVECSMNVLIFRKIMQPPSSEWKVEGDHNLANYRMDTVIMCPS
jgi:hypothetical protein